MMGIALSEAVLVDPIAFDVLHIFDSEECDIDGCVQNIRFFKTRLQADLLSHGNS